ncbi:tetratricopeptide repeat protein [Flavobacteriaceae sp. LMIT009]
MKYITILIVGFLVLKAEAQSSALVIGDSLYVRGNYTNAVNAYKQYTDSIKVFDKIAKAYIGLGNYDEALHFYNKSVDQDSTNELVKYEYAKLLSKTKKYEEASEEFHELIDVDYKNPNYHYELGLVLENLNDSTAQNRFWSAFQLDRTHQKAIYRMAKYNLIKGKNKLADYYIDIGLESYANNKELISLKAQNHYVRKQFEKAAIWFEKLVALNEKTQFIHEKLRNCYTNMMEYEKAITHGELALAFEKENVNNLFILGELYEKVFDYEKAEKYMRLSLVMQDVALDKEYSKLGTVLNFQKKHKEAIDIFKRAIEENPENENAQFYLVFTKVRYYKDIKTKIELLENYKIKFPESKFNEMADFLIKQLKEEQFLKED